MSEYQADWFTDESGQVDFRAATGNEAPIPGSGCGGDSDVDGDGEGEGDDLSVCGEGGAGGSLAGSLLTGATGRARQLRGKHAHFDPSLGPASTAAAVEAARAAAAEQDAEFPDEMDTPHDISARLRFARYRALQSFRASPWHPKENLPAEYARVFQFEDFPGIQRR